MKWSVVRDYEELSARAATIVLDLIERNPSANLGLPTGRTPLGMYREMVARCRDQYRCFQRVQTFNLDEYVGISAGHPASYASFMQRNFLAHVDIDPGRVHIPTGDPSLLRERFGADLGLGELLDRECRWYDEEIREAGGLDLVVLGLGRNGHIGFNEPGTPFDSVTHVVELDESTRKANAGDFPEEEMPRKAITMGLATIASARRVLLLASGASKRPPLERLKSGETGPGLPVSILRDHDSVEILADSEADPSSEHES